MSTSPFGAVGFGFPAFDPAAFERMGRQWLAALTPQPAPADPFAAWKPASPANAFDPSGVATQWMSQMQQLAAQFGGAQPADVARAWRAMLGDNPFAQAAVTNAFVPPSFAMPGAARGPFEQPAFGYTREHQERAQAFAKSVTEFQQAAQAFGAFIAAAGQDAYSRFESLLAQRSESGKPVESARALFDLWIDAAEDAYADVAIGEPFQKAFGDYVNAQMRVRAGIQKEIELSAAQLGLPGREEVDAAHRKITALEREVRRLRETVESLSAAPPAADAETAPTPKRGARTSGKR